jgi:phosphatidylserine/phosphatidylglycerophosphate/cardiolipin synthase-like enzyme
MTQFRQRRYLKIGLGLLLSLLIVVGIQFFQPELKGLAQQFLKAVGIQFSLLPSANPVSIPPLPQQQLIKAYFNHNQAASYTDPYRKITRPGDNLEQLIIDNINQAKSSIDIAVQELRLPKIVQALSDRSNAGVKVRLIIENTYNRGYSEFAEAERAGFNERERGKYTDFKAFADLNGDGNLSQDEINQRDSISMLKNAKIPYLDDRADGSSGSGLMHHKFVVIDGTIIVVTSANFTMSDIHGDFTAPMTTGNKNNALRIESPEVAKLFTEEFKEKFKLAFTRFMNVIIVTSTLIAGFGLGYYFKDIQDKPMMVNEVILDKEVRVAIDSENKLILMDRKTGGYDIYSDSVGRTIFYLYANKIAK